MNQVVAGKSSRLSPLDGASWSTAEFGVRQQLARSMDARQKSSSPRLIPGKDAPNGIARSRPGGAGQGPIPGQHRICSGMRFFAYRAVLDIIFE